MLIPFILSQFPTFPEVWLQERIGFFIVFEFFFVWIPFKRTAQSISDVG